MRELDPFAQAGTAFAVTVFRLQPNPECVRLFCGVVVTELFRAEHFTESCSQQRTNHSTNISPNTSPIGSSLWISAAT
jgi:hypothetical protein